MSVDSEAERIGLLFVHGVGEQQRWDHLRSSVQELAELLLQTGDNPRVTMIDRTGDWPHPPGHPDPAGLAPIVLIFGADCRQIEFHCYEVWWADLGARAGLGDAITFWLWGLGQWCAPIYRDLDAASLPKSKLTGTKKPVSTLATTPESVVGRIIAEPLARLQLVLAALAAAFVFCTWSLAKRVFAGLLGQAPTPTLIVRYVGDVRTYEARAAPGDSALSDPGRPRRVGIRRRMVSEMIALGTSACDGWYVIAHSLGTVLAYNGLTETGHALPNYLTEEQWKRVPAPFKRDPGCKRREDVGAMMPARPPWLRDRDVINRPLLFSKLRGFLTYGSPLDKFAGLWPRIVATATDRKVKRSPFPKNCPWINLVAPSDPVAGKLDSYGGAVGRRLANAIPTVENIRTPWSPKYGLAHIRYFAGVERYARSKGPEQKRAVARWLLNSAQPIPDHPQNWLMRLLSVQLAYPLLVFLLLLATTALVVAVVGTADRLIGQGEQDLSLLFQKALRPVLAAALALILLMGLYRWFSESRLNTRLASADRDSDADQSAERRRYWTRIIWMLRAQWVAGSALLLLVLLGGAAAIFGAVPEWLRANNCEALLRCDWKKLASGAFSLLDSWRPLIAIFSALVAAAIVQTLLNRIVPPVGKAPG